jgi:hypothetical protein
LIDCFLSGVVPIYWGCPSIGVFFNTSGIISFTHPRDLKSILTSIGADDYKTRHAAIEENHVLAQRYVYPEVHVWRNISTHCGVHARL